ncbi:MAG: NlpC/P60 family protein [Nanoarchaeota archaeon]
MGLEEIVDIAKSFLGAPSIHFPGYGNGGNMPDGFDCSGFVQYVLLEAGYNLPPAQRSGADGPIRTTDEFWDLFGVQVHRRFLQPGDLVFESRNGWMPTHTGIYVGVEGIRGIKRHAVIHAPGRDNTEVKMVLLSSWRGPPRFNPESGYDQLYGRNPIGFKRPMNYDRTRFKPKN